MSHLAGDLGCAHLEYLDVGSMPQMESGRFRDRSTVGTFITFVQFKINMLSAAVGIVSVNRKTGFCLSQLRRMPRFVSRRLIGNIPRVGALCAPVGYSTGQLLLFGECFQEL
jgi:hypothetical protein